MLANDKILEEEVFSKPSEHISCELLSQLFLRWMRPVGLLLELWVEFTGQFLQAQYPVYCVNKHFSSDLAQQQISTRGYTRPSVRLSAVGVNYSSWRLWRGKIAWQIVPRSPQGSEWDETDYEEISGNMGLVAEETDRCFYFWPSFVLLFVRLNIISSCWVTFNRFFRWKKKKTSRHSKLAFEGLLLGKFACRIIGVCIIILLSSA